MPTENLPDTFFSLLKNNSLFSNIEKKSIVNELNNTPELLAYFLWKCTLATTEEIETVIKKLIDLEAFNKTTINQIFVSNTFFNRQQLYSVSYLLLSNAEGRKILKENQSLRDLIGEELSENHIKQFVHQNTHEGVLYYLLADEEVGQKLLKEYPNFREKIDKIVSLDKTVLAKQIADGPHKGQSLGDLYELIFPHSLNKTFAL